MRNYIKYIWGPFNNLPKYETYIHGRIYTLFFVIIAIQYYMSIPHKFYELQFLQILVKLFVMTKQRKSLNRFICEQVPTL